jgi:hypothetical protein
MLGFSPLVSANLLSHVGKPVSMGFNQQSFPMFILGMLKAFQLNNPGTRSIVNETFRVAIDV